MNSKKTLFFAAVLIDLTAALYGQNATDFVVEGTVLTGYKGTATDVVIPANLGITEIGDAFQIYSKITSVVIPATVTKIGVGAFVWCESLTSINVDEGNTAYSSENGVLYNKNKTTLVVYPGGKKGVFAIPNGVTGIGEEAFNCCINLTGVIIPDSVTNIGDRAFYNCTGLIKADIGKGITRIGEKAFAWCERLTGVTLSSGLTGIDGNAFAGCISLASVTFAGTIKSNRFDNSVFPGDLHDKFYATDKKNGTPGTYTTTNPGYNAVWTKK